MTLVKNADTTLFFGGIKCNNYVMKMKYRIVYIRRKNVNNVIQSIIIFHLRRP